jgi:5-methyltetrahydropteroyltriglutamate--homocysteine methyltransferase
MNVKRSVGRILTTHVGSLPRPNDLVELYRDNAPDDRLLPRLRSAITDVVQRQSLSGIDIVNDGEFGKAMRRSVDFGAWWSYVYDRLAGFEVREEAAKKGRAAWTFGSKERKEFAEFYAEEASAGQTASQAYGVQGSTSSARMYGLTCVGPVKYTGQRAIARDTENLAAALRAAKVEEACKFCRTNTTRAGRTTPGRWLKRSLSNTGPLSTPGSFCRSMTLPWSISTTGGTQ